jgi:glutamyl-tRNA synthetase
MILGDDGQKLSKRHGAVSVMQYDEAGYLPEAVLNYLARLGWSHGDDEVFTMTQFCDWFDLDHITASAAQFNTEKLNWLNAHYIKTIPLVQLGTEIRRRLDDLGVKVDAMPSLDEVLSLYRERANNLNQLAKDIAFFYAQPVIDEQDKAKHLTSDALPMIKALLNQLEAVEWTAESIHAAMNAVVTEYGVKFPKLAMPLRVLLTGIAQSPSIDQVMAILGKETCILRLKINNL